MATRILAILFVCALLAVAVVAIIAYVYPRHDGPPAATPDAPSADQTGDTQSPAGTPPAVQPVKPRTPQTATGKVAPVPRGEATAIPPLTSPTPEEVAQARQEAQEEIDEAAGKVREQTISEFTLTPEQIEIADKALAAIEEVVRSQTALDLRIESKARSLTLKRQAAELGWSPEQARQIGQQAERDSYAGRQGKMMDYLDDSAAALERFRPLLTPEQTPILDRKLEALKRYKEVLLQGELHLF